MILSLLLFFAQGAGGPAVPPPQSLPIVALHAPRAVVNVQVAQTEQERERGLMGVRKLAPHTGMVFVFASDSPVTFWMKDTLVPLDMVFVARGGVVRGVFARVPVVAPQTPDDRIPRRQGKAMYVIELPAGEAARDGIRPGVRIGDLSAGIA